MSEDARAWIQGVTAPLPPGERVRWQGAPDRRALARRVFHVRKVVLYFAVLIAWRAAASTGEDPAMGYFLAGAIPLVGLGSICIGCSYLLARVTERTTIYAVTDKRVVLRIGLVLQSTINIPFRQIEAAQVKVLPDGTGDIALRLGDQDRLAYFMLWPHARAWYLSHPQPTLRCIPDAERVGALLREGVVGISEVSEPPASMAPRHEPPAELVSAAPAEAVA